MKRLTAILLFLIVAVTAYYFAFRKNKQSGPPPVPTSIQKHSEVFNKTINKIVGDYLALKDAFVEADTAVIKSKAHLFIESIDRIDTTEMKKDTITVFSTLKVSLDNLKQNAGSILQQTDLTEMRRDFYSLSSEMYPGFFKLTGYEGPTLYQQSCPMAFGEDNPASWISNSKEILNPYLGRNHPEYKGTMLHCGELLDSIKAK